MAKSESQRAAALRERRAAQDLHEVRGIWAPKRYHIPIRFHVAAAMPKTSDPVAVAQAFKNLDDALKAWFSDPQKARLGRD